jgi:hypothetical protein
MAAFVYKCPVTGRNVQGWVADDGDIKNDVHHPVKCIACQRVHLVNPNSRKVLGANEE